MGIRKLLRMDLQHFAEGEEGSESADIETGADETSYEDEDFSKYISSDGNLDIDSLVTDYSNNETDHEKHQENTGETTGDESETDNSEKGEGGPTSHEDDPAGDETQEPETHVNKDEQGESEKRTPDAAFAEMRRRAEQNEKFANWVQDLAKKQGFSDPEQLIEAFNRQQLAKEAEAKGVPVDVYERLHQLEQENRQKDELMFQERFNQEVADTQKKYNLSDEQINDTFKFMAQRGFIDENGRTNIPFEDAYTLANKDTFIEQAKEQAKQEYLKGLEKKQKGAAPNPKTAATDANNGDDIDLSTENIFATLDKLDIDWRH